MRRKESLPTIEVPQFPGEVFDSIQINDMISFEVESAKEASLHVNEVFGEDGQKENISEKMRLLHEGLAGFAALLKHDRTLKDIETITAFSWIVSEHPKLIEKFGFTIDSPNNYFQRLRSYYGKNRIGGVKTEKLLKKPGFAYITREKFLELYGEK